MSLVPGARLGSFEILSPLGAGGMGEVYRARDVRLQRDVAIKVLQFDDAVAPDARRLLREARAAARLNHPAICTVHEIGEDDGVAYIAMELVEGQSLSAMLAERSLSADGVVRLGLARDLAAGVAHAHERGVVHGDLKPANVMVTPEGRVKILDFGLARAVVPDAATASLASFMKPGTLAGTIAYMAPEQLRGAPANTRSDVWALGMILAEMAAGAPDIPPATRGVIARAVDPDPARRYGTADELCAALEAIRAGVAPSEVSPSGPSHRSWLAVAALLGVGAIAVGLNVGGARDRLAGHAPAAAPIKLAVLPFANLTGDSEQEFFSDGLTQEMITRLGRLHPQGLSVIARTSSMRYKKSTAPIEQIGRELGVDYVLEGSARREGSRVRISATLIQVRGQTPRWSDSFERELSGILALQSEVARGVTGSLALTLLPAEQAGLSTRKPSIPKRMKRI
jgi:TolB-like protein